MKLTNMKKLSFFLLTALLVGCTQQTENKTEKVIDEPIEEWTILFDGSSFDQWHGYNNGDEMHKEWTLVDGAMVFTPGESGGKNIVTNTSYTNFVLSLEWKISEGGNSGIFWGVFEDTTYSEAYHTGPEIQVLDNERHPDANVNGKLHQAGALYDMIEPEVDMVKPAGEWNLCVITIDHNKNQGIVEMNGTKIVEFTAHGEEWDNMVANSKFADWKGFGKYQTGKIGLQDHGDIVSYRNIKIKELK